MEITVLGRTRKGTLDFKIESEDEFGLTVQCEDSEGMVRYHNIQSFEWIARGRVVYMDPSPVKDKEQFNFDRFDVVKITKAKKIADNPFEHHYFRN